MFSLQFWFCPEKEPLSVPCDILVSYFIFITDLGPLKIHSIFVFAVWPKTRLGPSLWSTDR